MEIVPLIDMTDKEKEIEKLISDYNFKTDVFFGMRIKLGEIDLDDPKGIRVLLIDLALKLNELGFKSLNIDEDGL